MVFRFRTRYRYGRQNEALEIEVRRALQPDCMLLKIKIWCTIGSAHEVCLFQYSYHQITIVEGETLLSLSRMYVDLGEWQLATAAGTPAAILAEWLYSRFRSLNACLSYIQASLLLCTHDFQVLVVTDMSRIWQWSSMQYSSDIRVSKCFFCKSDAKTPPHQCRA